MSEESEKTKVWCPNSFCNRFKLYCIYGCPDKVECGVYERNYESFKGMEIPEIYISKYGEPQFPLPNSIILKEKLHTKKEKEAARKEKEELLLNKKVARERKKQLKLKSIEEKKKIKEMKRAEKEVPKVKRKRRTGAEIEMDYLQERMSVAAACIKKEEEKVKEAKKRHRRTKAEMMLARGVVPTEVSKPTEVVTTRYRKTPRGSSTNISNLFS
jgi:hypothetical protein